MEGLFNWLLQRLFSNGFTRFQKNSEAYKEIKLWRKQLIEVENFPNAPFDVGSLVVSCRELVDMEGSKG